MSKCMDTWRLFFAKSENLPIIDEIIPFLKHRNMSSFSIRELIKEVKCCDGL